MVQHNRIDDGYGELIIRGEKLCKSQTLGFFINLILILLHICACILYLRLQFSKIQHCVVWSIGRVWCDVCVWWHVHRNWFSSFIWRDKSVCVGRVNHSVGYCQPRCAHQLAAWVLGRLSPSYMWRLKTTHSILLFPYQFSSIAFLCIITLQSCCTNIFRNLLRQSLGKK